MSNHASVLSIYRAVITPALALAHPTQIIPTTRWSVCVANVRADALSAFVFIPIVPLETFKIREDGVLNLPSLFLGKRRWVSEPPQLLTHVLDESNTDFVRGAVGVDGLLKTGHDGDGCISTFGGGLLLTHITKSKSL